MKKAVALLLCLAHATACESGTRVVGELPGISEPHSPEVLGDRLLFLDGHTAHLYSLTTLEPEVSFAGQGEDPHLFRYWPRLGVDGETIYGMDFTKTSWFSPQGELLRTIPYSDFQDYDPGMEMVLMPAGRNFVRVMVDHDTNRRWVQLFDHECQLIRTLHEGLFDWQGPVPAYRIDVAVEGELIVVSDTEKGFYISIFDTEGNHIRTIDRTGEMERVPFTEADQEAYLEAVRATGPDWLYEQLNRDRRFKSHFPMINHVQVDDGRLYVFTARRRDRERELLVLDLEGRTLATHYLPLESISLTRGILRFDPVLVHRDRLYEIVRNDSTGNHELLVTDLR